MKGGNAETLNQIKLILVKGKKMELVTIRTSLDKTQKTAKINGLETPAFFVVRRMATETKGKTNYQVTLEKKGIYAWTIYEKGSEKDFAKLVFPDNAKKAKELEKALKDYIKETVES